MGDPALSPSDSVNLHKSLNSSSLTSFLGKQGACPIDLRKLCSGLSEGSSVHGGLGGQGRACRQLVSIRV